MIYKVYKIKLKNVPKSKFGVIHNDNIVIAKERVNPQLEIYHYNNLLVTFIEGCETAYQTNVNLTLR